MMSGCRVKKAQVSTEFIFAVATIILIFLLILHFSFERKIDTTQIGEALDARSECLKISNTISGVYSSGSGTIAETKTDYLISISGNGISLKEDATSEDVALCFFVGKSQDYTNLNGILLVKNEDGVVVVE